MISLAKCNGRSVDDLSTEICVRNKATDVNAKVF